MRSQSTIPNSCEERLMGIGKEELTSKPQAVTVIQELIEK